MSKPKKLTARGVEIMIDLFKSVEAMSALKQKTDAEVADLVEQHLMGDISMVGPQYTLLEDVVRRLRKEEP